MFAFPSETEQVCIVNYLHIATADATRAINEISRQITFLAEFRTRLIADVTTGKLDVRAAAAALPESADELETIDAIEESEAGEEALDDGADAEIGEAAA